MVSAGAHGETPTVKTKPLGKLACPRPSLLALVILALREPWPYRFYPRMLGGSLLLPAYTMSSLQRSGQVTLRGPARASQP